MSTLSCIGAGLLGKTICRLLSGHLSIGQIINRSQQSAQRAVNFIGTGTAASIDHLCAADIWLIATPDDSIASIADRLFESGILQNGNMLFHCSGSLDSGVLNCPHANVHTASVHPIHSFANPLESLTSFAGSHCAVEGQPKAVEILTDLFSDIGALPFTISSQYKSLYHAATVMACNYLISLLQLSQQMLIAAGVKAIDQANPLEPLIRQTLDNYFDSNAVKALTGPISRGDADTIAKHLNSLGEMPDTQLWQQAYCSLGRATLPISAQQGRASPEQLQTIGTLLQHRLEEPEASTD